MISCAERGGAWPERVSGHTFEQLFIALPPWAWRGGQLAKSWRTTVYSKGSPTLYVEPGA